LGGWVWVWMWGVGVDVGCGGEGVVRNGCLQAMSKLPYGHLGHRQHRAKGLGRKGVADPLAGPTGFAGLAGREVGAAAEQGGLVVLGVVVGAARLDLRGPDGLVHEPVEPGVLLADPAAALARARVVRRGGGLPRELGEPGDVKWSHHRVASTDQQPVSPGTGVGHPMRRVRGGAEKCARNGPKIRSKLPHSAASKSSFWAQSRASTTPCPDRQLQPPLVFLLTTMSRAAWVSSFLV